MWHNDLYSKLKTFLPMIVYAGIDILYTGSQKVLNAPPGTAPISFSERAWWECVLWTAYANVQWKNVYWREENCSQPKSIQSHNKTCVVLLGFELAFKLLGMWWQASKNVRHLRLKTTQEKMPLCKVLSSFCLLNRYHHTVPVTALYSLRESLAVLADEVGHDLESTQ